MTQLSDKLSGISRNYASSSVKLYIFKGTKPMTDANWPVARIAALFTGTPRQIPIDGRPDITAFARVRRSGQVTVGASGLEGNALGTQRGLGLDNHALYLLAAAHYSTHEARLGRPVPPGGFAENVLYADGPDETGLRIGARLRLGSAMIEAMSPRVPCYKLAHFLGADQGFPAAFSASGRTGFYARVTVPGAVSEGATLVLDGQDERNATLADLNHALTDPNPDPMRIDLVLNSPALLPGLRALITDRFSRLRPELAQGAVPARITAKHRLAPDITRIEIAPEGGGWPWLAGQFVTVGRDDKGDGNVDANGSRQEEVSGLLRSYSLIDGPGPDAPDRPFAIAVRRGQAPAGLSLSRWLEGCAAPGDALRLYPPEGGFVLARKTGPVLLIGGGIGMTPILSLLRALAARAHLYPVTLLQVARTADDLIFAPEIAAALACLPDGHLVRHVTCRKDTTLGSQMVTQAGALPRPRFGRPDLHAAIAASPKGADVYVCGPEGMIRTAEAAHRALGRPPARFHSEAFAPPAASATEGFDDLPAAPVHVSGLGLLGDWNAADGPLLSWIEARLKRKLPASCRSGMCRTCAAGLVRGRMRYPAGITPPRPGTALLCCARPDGPVELDLS